MDSQFIIIFAGGSKNDLLLMKKDPPLSEAWLVPCRHEFFWCFYVFIGAGTNFGQILDKFCPRPEVEPYEQLQVSHSVGAGNKL